MVESFVYSIVLVSLDAVCFLMKWTRTDFFLRLLLCYSSWTHFNEMDIFSMFMFIVVNKQSYHSFSVFS